MVTATLETEGAFGAAEALKHVLAGVETLSPRTVHTALVICDFIQSMFKMAHASIQSGLCQGVEARAFAVKYEQAIVRLDEIRDIVGRLLAKVKGQRLPSLGEDLISRYEDLDSDLTRIRKFLLEAVQKAKMPTRAIDWERVREAEAAYSRGEMKPYRKSGT
ncbi:MAG TPA: hypothetical protein VMG10_13015 [Gemmataceae bacterium]|nr:hypothetical protein [Gemmataceae bacterium]